MGRKFDIITIGMMIALIIILFVVVFNYYTHSRDDKPLNDVSNIIDTDIKLQDIEESGEILKNNPVTTQSEEILKNNPAIMQSGEIIKNNPVTIQSGEDSDNNSNDNKKETNISGKIEKKESGDIENPNGVIDGVYTVSDSSVIMTSNDNIFDKEKKEVLQELDQTLMELLDVIDNVKTVDVTLLEEDGNEVQKWKR